MKKLKKLLTLIVISLAFVTPNVFPSVFPITAIAAAPVMLNTTDAVLIKGQILSLKLKGTDAKVQWKSQDKKIATVSSSGKITAKGQGKTTVTAKLGMKRYKCIVTVETPKMNRKSASMKVGKTLQLKLTGTNQKISWNSSNTSVATVTDNGKISAKKPGKCSIVAKISNKTYKCSITVKQVTESSSGTSSSDTTPSTDSAEVWLSATGTKYHLIPDCGTMNPDKARKVSKTEAISRDYEACKKCFY